MRLGTTIALAALLLCGAALAAPDGGPDAGPDAGGPCSFGDADCSSSPWMWCDSDGAWVATDCFGSETAPLVYSPCNCAPEDPCGWANDTICDAACVEEGLVDEMFDDSADCAPAFDAGADSDSDADTDADTDTSTDTAPDAATGGGGDTGCSCAIAGRPAAGALLSRLF